MIEKAAIALDRCRNGLSSRGLLLVGLRGVGKTVLLTKMANEAEAGGFATIFVEAPEKRSLPSLIIPSLRSCILKLNRTAAAGQLAKKAMTALGSFISAARLKYSDIEFSLDVASEPGVADSGDLEYDLIDLLTQVGGLAREKNTALALFIDEIQYIEESQFAAFIMALHKCAQKQLPVLLIGAGLPQLVGQAGKAKSYAERLFEYPEIGPLTNEAAEAALVAPARKLNVKYDPAAIEHILQHTQNYPYFLQEWGKHCWASAKESPITVEDVSIATELAVSDLDSSFFRVRFDRLTATEKKYLRAMAELRAGCRRSGDIAGILNKDVKAVAPIRSSLIRKGMIYSLSHGENEFTVPLFDTYLKRVLPDPSD